MQDLNTISVGTTYRLQKLLSRPLWVAGSTEKYLMGCRLHRKIVARWVAGSTEKYLMGFNVHRQILDGLQGPQNVLGGL